MAEAQAVAEQLANTWPSNDTLGIVTSLGRTFHVSDACPGYQQGIRNAEKRGVAPQEIERVDAAEARTRGKAACRRCWRDGMALIPN
jgi:hypothetical protein